MAFHSSRTYPGWALARIQELELEMLAAVDGICRSEGLTYFVDGGTCLGALRHDGLIPWDDDTDVGMPLNDYRTFLKIAPERLPDGMSLHTMENTPGFSALWAKVYLDHTRFLDEAALEAGCPQGIFLDVLPYVPLNGPVGAATRSLLKLERWQKVSYLRHIGSANIPEGASLRTPKVAACVLAHAVLSRTTTDDFVRARHERLFVRGASGEFWANPCASKPYPYAREVLFEPVEHEFCGMSVFVPHDADAYLSQLYGNWRAMPAPKDRCTHTPVVLDFGDGVNVMDERER